ncbi:Similar to Sphingolipid long chain base-responsive protein LSP1; acc. no. Q12230 [Pyronema omphalodes CBS 100304]|uniref:Similar to Sphingolipid long chain base-responsive protein LSP1 acc. no. Q12230 n=1 Tax=Pyronema omphalodes (strain CBS 100304) TaxID=1076935 RepID=U4LF50_PYROM|nr:Similar to Sphingolipid long chain base-responsive protein LSP1; acc. no. Q12230 [Pyronema omphalodes CBS 100304]
MPLLPPPYSARKQSPPPARSGTVKSSPRSRSLSVRKKNENSTAAPPPPKKHRFTLASLRGNYQPELSRRLFRLIKSENYVINSYETAGHEQKSVANQLSEWGEHTGDDAVNELSDKLGVLLSELGNQEEAFAQNLEEYRSILKQIRNCESSVQPSRDHKSKINEEIAKLRYKDPSSTRITTLEQELVRAEAENLVAEAQLTNVTRSKLKEAFAQQFVAVIERADKQTILARNGLRMLNLLDDTPVVPGETIPPFEQEKEANQILLDAEEELKDWSLNIEEEVTTNAHVVTGGVIDGIGAAASSIGSVAGSVVGMPAYRTTPQMGSRTPSRNVTPSPMLKSAAPPEHLVHPAIRHVSGSSSVASSSGERELPYPLSQSERSVGKSIMRRQESMLAMA